MTSKGHRGWREQGHRLGHVLLTPVRMYRQRTSVQLIVSHVLAVLLTVILFFAGFVGAFFWAPASRMLNLEDFMIDPFLGERARSVALYLDPDELATTINNPERAAQPNNLNGQLAMIVAGAAPGFDPPRQSQTLPRTKHIAVIGLDGHVIATSDRSWIAPGDSSTDLDLSGSQDALNETTSLNGSPEPNSGTLYSLHVTGEQTSATYPIVTSSGRVVGIILLEGNPWSQVIGESRVELFRNLIRAIVETLWILAIPALMVSVPFGIWRARTISNRLARLADAADAMADGDRPMRINVTRRDEVGRLAERFNEMGAHIEHSDVMRRAFISNVSHELRTPVSIIQGTAEQQLSRLEREGESPDGPWNAVVQETSMLSRLINDLFTLTRIEEHNLRLDRSPISLATVTEEGIAGIRELAWTQSRVSIESLISRDLPPVMADPTRVRQIIINLVHNALRHTPTGGLIVLQAKEMGAMIQVSTSDTGRGIPAEDLPNVFKRYFQSERDARHDDTSGLGLAVVHQLVGAHGGEITVESVEGQGTTFRFTLPQAT